jgi:hypothetical protein
MLNEKRRLLREQFEELDNFLVGSFHQDIESPESA